MSSQWSLFVVLVAACILFAGVGEATTCTFIDKTVQNAPTSLQCLEQWVKTTQNPDQVCPAGEWVGTAGKTIECKIHGRETTQSTIRFCAQKKGTVVTYTDQQPNTNDEASGSLTPTQAIRNAKPAIDARYTYTQCSWEINGFRVDCVGLICRAWNLKRGAAYTTASLKKYSDEIDCSQLVPGDIFLNDPHVMLFHHWDDDAHTKVTVWHASGGSVGHIESSGKDLATMKNDDNYRCYRYKRMSGITGQTNLPPNMTPVSPTDSGFQAEVENILQPVGAPAAANNNGNQDGNSAASAPGLGSAATGAATTNAAALPAGPRCVTHGIVGACTKRGDCQGMDWTAYAHGRGGTEGCENLANDVRCCTPKQ